MGLNGKRTDLFRTIFNFSLCFCAYGIKSRLFYICAKKEPLQSLNVVPKIKWKTNKGSLLEKMEKEAKQDKMSKWA